MSESFTPTRYKVRRRLPVVALFLIQLVIIISYGVSRDQSRAAEVQHLLIFSGVRLPEFRVFGIWVYVACEVDDGFLKKLGDLLVNRGFGFDRRVVLWTDLV